MNNFVFLIELNELSGPQVRYYTVQFERKKSSEFEDFLLRHENRKDLAEKLDELLYWLEDIAQSRGALAHLFRFESKAHALPPKQRLNLIEANNLRLYCLRLSDRIVVLFNGGEKTAAKSQDCPNVYPYFNQANRLAEAIDECLRSKELRIDDDETSLVYPSNFEILL